MVPFCLGDNIHRNSRSDHERKPLFESVAVIQNLFPAALSCIEDIEVNGPVATPLVNSDKLGPLILVPWDSLNDIQPVNASNVPRRISQLVEIHPDRGSPQ